ncbi:hypothetical protein Tco_0311400 [Tanacetum coccineum]
MHNNIMAAGSKDRPPMLGPGRYSQWRSHFLCLLLEIEKPWSSITHGFYKSKECVDMEQLQAEQGVHAKSGKVIGLLDTDEEINEQELEAHYSFMAKIQEVLPEESSSTE